MNSDDFKKKLLAPILWGNLLAMVLVTVAICFGLWMWMDNYTRHGEKISVPNVVGQFEASAVYQLETLGDAREQTLMYMRMIFPEIDKSLTKLFEMRLEMKKLFPPEQMVM